MVLFISDIHFGRSTPTEDRIREQSLIKCLQHFEAELTALYLVGDVFEQYIEYKHLIPKGFIRLQAYLASLTDRKISIHYIVGNHDPWHLDYFKEELGIEIIFDYLTISYFNVSLFITHGDGCEAKKPFNGWIRRLTRLPWVVRMYRMFMFGDSGFALARWVSKTFHTNSISSQTVQNLRHFAEQYLDQTYIHQTNKTLSPKFEQTKLVVMGHSHLAELTCYTKGLYLNLGFWHQNQTFGVLTDKACKLMKWENDHALVLKQEITTSTTK